MRPNDDKSGPSSEQRLVMEPDSRGVVLPVRAQAGARRNGILGLRGGMLRVAVTAAPEKGKANKALTGILSEALGVPKSAIVLLSGDSSACKRFLILGRNIDELRPIAERLTRDA